MVPRTLVADCGGTSCEWRIITEKDVIDLPVSPGFNPTSQPIKDLKESILSNERLASERHLISAVFYYGAGCASKTSKLKVEGVLASVFKNAEIAVDTDLWGAVRAVYRGKPLICGILGTGSNACLFNGEQLVSGVPSLGFILGDEGSGNHIGRLLLKSYYYGDMPPELRGEFESDFNLEIDHVLENIHRKPGAAAFLAQHTRFASNHISHPFINQLVAKSIAEFLQRFVQPLLETNEYELGLVGSVAYYFRDIIEAESDRKNIRLGQVLQRPIDGLVDCHR